MISALPSLLLLASLVQADKVDELIRAEMKASHVPGLAFAVVKDGKIVKVGAYGTANIETDTPVKPETVFRIASMSKQFCASAAMLLVEDGKWKLDDPIGKYLVDPPATWAKVTLRHLLTHTAGMPKLTDQDGFNFRTNPGPDAYVAMLAKKPLVFDPGRKFEYSNEGYSLLGILVGKVAGMPLPEFVEERILKPVGMTATTYYKLENLVPNRANGYLWNQDQHQNAIPLRPYAMAGSGGMMSSVLDFAKWDAALQTNFPLSQKVKDQMWKAGVLNDGKPTTYGFGWGVQGKVVAHSGGTAGFGSHFIRHLERRLSVIVFENVQNGKAVELANKIAELYLKESPPK